MIQVIAAHCSRSEMGAPTALVTDMGAHTGVCTACRGENPLAARFCMHCGAVARVDSVSRLLA